MRICTFYFFYCTLDGTRICVSISCPFSTSAILMICEKMHKFRGVKAVAVASSECITVCGFNWIVRFSVLVDDVSSIFKANTLAGDPEGNV